MRQEAETAYYYGIGIPAFMRDLGWSVVYENPMKPKAVRYSKHGAVSTEEQFKKECQLAAIAHNLGERSNVNPKPYGL